MNTPNRKLKDEQKIVRDVLKIKGLRRINIYFRYESPIPDRVERTIRIIAEDLLRDPMISIYAYLNNENQYISPLFSYNAIQDRKGTWDERFVHAFVNHVCSKFINSSCLATHKITTNETP